MSLAFEGATLGQFGHVVRTGTTAQSADAGKTFVAIQAINNTNFQSFTEISPNSTFYRLASTTLANSTTIPAGTILYGKFTAFQIHSGGAVIAYYGS
jgi:hypothetical protein